MIDERLAELRALADAATPGIWDFTSHNVPGTYRAHILGEPPVLIISMARRDEDLAFIAASRTAIPELLDVIARVKKVLAEESFHADGITQSIEVVETSDLRAALDWTYVK